MNIKTPTPNGGDKNSKLIEVKLPAGSLEIGMHVTRLDRPWTELPLLLQGLTINSFEDAELLQEHCQYVYIEIDKEFWIESVDRQGGGQHTQKVYPGFRETNDFHEELAHAKVVFEDVRGHVELLLDNIEKHETFDISSSRSVISSCVKSILSNANALQWLCKIKDESHYTAEHCMRVGILAIAFGRFLGLKEKELRLLGMCGILHDVGKMKIPIEILDKPGRLSSEEFEVMKTHSALGKDILSQYEDLEPMIRDAAHYHHERIDGKGYPEGLHGGYLHKYIRIITIVDAYDAITSDRIYKEGSPAFDALKILFAERNKHFDSELVEAFIQMIGIYPPGTLVEMTNGEVAIVMSANSESRLRPTVELVLTADKKTRRPYVVNLIDSPLDQFSEPYVIKSGLSNGTYDVDVKDFIQLK